MPETTKVANISDSPPMNGVWRYIKMITWKWHILHEMEEGTLKWNRRKAWKLWTKDFRNKLVECSFFCFLDFREAYFPISRWWVFQIPENCKHSFSRFPRSAKMFLPNFDDYFAFFHFPDFRGAQPCFCFSVVYICFLLLFSFRSLVLFCFCFVLFVLFCCMTPSG